MAIRSIVRNIPSWTLLFSLLVACTSVDTSVKVTQRGWILELPEEERVAVTNLLRSKQFGDLDKRDHELQRQYERGQIDDRSLTLEYQERFARRSAKFCRPHVSHDL
ncbi:MAG: hypothetical protein KF722_09045 [Nitrospira sp.]|nr:hypothetical protein [Nitrospira sp.]